MMARLRTRSESDGGAIPQRVHLVGAGGMHMSAIGTILLARGHVVTGSDIVESEHTRRLQAAGGTIYLGHAAANVGRAELVVTTVAARDDNPELAAARERGVTVIVRAEMVRRLVAGRELLAVAGTHGKTTTTTLLALMTLHAGLDPLVLAGGDSPELDGNARDGAGRFAIVEADEYAAAFLQYEPQLALVTNIEVDHLDYYGSEQRLLEAFAAFAERVQPGGTLFVCADSPAAAALGETRRAAGVRVERYGLDADAEWRAVQVRGNDRGGLECVVLLDGAELGRMSLRIPGRHNVANALGALAMAMRAGVDFHRAVQAAEEFGGVHRRFELVGEAGGVTVVDDYAHHPTEVRATVQAARTRFPGRRLVGCFQPHTYSRSRYLAEGFRTCFEGLDALYVTSTYAAREQADAGSNGATLAAQVTRPAPRYAATLDEALELAARELRPGDVLLTLGAGDIEHLGPQVLARLERAP
ncbi:MAG: UDP-N-acetylmuramate--L-alanine ligase [Chloroflexi bacterium]|nr:UDP-N-acetylmuramate--L-alanine ligase [Chloroflexota bacterium]